MAAPPILDFDSIDLSQIVVDRAELDRYLPQRGHFSMLDGILHENIEAGLIVGFKEIRSEDYWAKDHIPGNPMFPGVLQIEASAQLASYDFSAHRAQKDSSVPDRFVGFAGVDKVRFRAVVVPDCRLIVAISLKKHSRRMFRYEAQGFVDRKKAFEAEVLGVLL